jgi:hypothetical protein
MLRIMKILAVKFINQQFVAAAGVLAYAVTR